MLKKQKVGEGWWVLGTPPAPGFPFTVSCTGFGSPSLVRGGFAGQSSCWQGSGDMLSALHLAAWGPLCLPTQGWALTMGRQGA